jgi:hypothetical protein
LAHILHFPTSHADEVVMGGEVSKFIVCVVVAQVDLAD